MEIKNIAIKDLQVDKYNARQGTWVEDEELISSIEKQGIIEPLVVRKLADGYSIICGSRRWNAARKAGLKEVPCIVKEMSDIESLGLSLQENMQRGNLDSIQEAEGIAKMWEMMNGSRTPEEKFTELTKRYGWTETTIRNKIALSSLSDEVKTFFERKHAKEKPLIDDEDIGISLSRSSWDKKEKVEAAKILSNIDGGLRRRKLLSEMRKYEDESTPQQAYQKVKKIMRINSYRYRPSTLQMNQAMDTAAKEWETDYNGVIDKCVTSEFQRHRWL